MLVSKVLRNSKIDKSNVQEIIAVGGSNPIPGIVKFVSEIFNVNESVKFANRRHCKRGENLHLWKTFVCAKKFDDVRGYHSFFDGLDISIANPATGLYGECVVFGHLMEDHCQWKLRK